jgi:hypothetical protein
VEDYLFDYVFAVKTSRIRRALEKAPACDGFAENAASTFDSGEQPRATMNYCTTYLGFHNQSRLPRQSVPTHVLAFACKEACGDAMKDKSNRQGDFPSGRSGDWFWDHE